MGKSINMPINDFTTDELILVKKAFNSINFFVDYCEKRKDSNGKTVFADCCECKVYRLCNFKYRVIERANEILEKTINENDIY